MGTGTGRAERWHPEGLPQFAWLRIQIARRSPTPCFAAGGGPAGTKGQACPGLLCHLALHDDLPREEWRAYGETCMTDSWRGSAAVAGAVGRSNLASVRRLRPMPVPVPGSNALVEQTVPIDGGVSVP